MRNAESGVLITFGICKRRAGGKLPQFFKQVKFQAEDFNHTGLNVHVHEGRETDAAVLFVHGLGGSGYGTWGMWPELVFEQETVQPLDVAVFQYSSFHKAWRNWKLGADLPFHVGQLADWIRVLSEDYGYSDIYLVAHSLGGLVVESAVYEYLMQLGKKARDLTPVAALFLLAAPRTGAGLALSALRNVFPEFEWLRRKSPQLMKAESYFRSNVESLGSAASAGYYEYLIPRYSAMAGGDRVVSKMSGLFGVPEQQRLRLNGNHRTIVKPDAKNQGQHQRLLKIVKQSNDIRQAWRIQARHDARFDSSPRPQVPLLVTELSGDDIDVDWERAYNRGCLQSSSGDVQVSDRRNSLVTSVQPTDILITVHDAQSVLDGNQRCRVVIDKAFERHQTQEELTLLIVVVGPNHERAVDVVQSWLPDPPYRSLSFEGVENPGGLTGVVAAWTEVMIERDPIRWPRSAAGQFYGAEGNDFV
ncbi:alpha/beta fold hydrolase [Streptomyces sp. NPDC006700]|uniref:esterase/lipase family protein n=1 Tax=unclassified Streptomyces TaxID=2593676 RepID=UPI0034069F31